ncbi:MAG: hypothetical protein OXC63_01385 [Aestuariivita sp.]|nr:hypothetical protein [Aestuariivita sp.]MCY4345608.1 hypothetical protein [Aestuariivita sp.]
MTIAGPVTAQEATLGITERWVSSGNENGTEGFGGITVDEGEEVEFTINGTLPLGATGGLRVKIGCGGVTNCYKFANTYPRIGTSDSSNPNTWYEIPHTTRPPWENSGSRQTISFPFLVTTKDDNCKKRGAPRRIDVTIQVYRIGGTSPQESVRITITDDDRDAADPLGFITFLKPECESDLS